jgi:hypothetical protein
MGTSIRPVVSTLPASAKILVPLLFAVPIDEYQAAPPLMIGAILPKVSTLLMSVGLPHKPLCAG